MTNQSKRRLRGRLPLRRWATILLAAGVGCVASAGSLLRSGRSSVREALLVGSIALALLLGSWVVAHHAARRWRLIPLGAAIGVLPNILFLLAKGWFEIRGGIDPLVSGLMRLSDLIGLPGKTIPAALGDPVPLGHPHQIASAFVYAWVRFSVLNVLAWALIGLLLAAFMPKPETE